MRPGDIHTHVFAQQFPVVDEDGKVFDYMTQARERGVIFDLGHGAGSFWFRHAVPAIADGFVPDSISTDLHTGNVAGVVIDMLTCMNKMLNIGVDLPRSDRSGRRSPRRAKSTGRNSARSPSAVWPTSPCLRWTRGRSPTSTASARRSPATQRLRCEMTVFSGKVVYNPNGRGLVTWEQDAIDNPVPFHVRAQEF